MHKNQCYLNLKCLIQLTSVFNLSVLTDLYDSIVLFIK